MIDTKVVSLVSLVLLNLDLNPDFSSEKYSAGFFILQDVVVFFQFAKATILFEPKWNWIYFVNWFH